MLWRCLADYTDAFFLYVLYCMAHSERVHKKKKRLWREMNKKLVEKTQKCFLLAEEVSDTYWQMLVEMLSSTYLIAAAGRGMEPGGLGPAPPCCVCSCIFFWPSSSLRDALSL